MQADVANTLGILRNNTNATLVHLGLYLHKVCELTLPRFKEGGCLSYQRVGIHKTILEQTVKFLKCNFCIQHNF